MKNVDKQMIAFIFLEVSFVILTAWLFFDFSFLSILLIFYLPFAFRKRWKERKRQQKWELNLAFRDAITCLEHSLAVGYSPESSLKEAMKELEQLYGSENKLCLEIRQMIKQIELGNSMEQVFLDFGKRSGVEDIRQLAEVFSIVKRTGGNLGQVLRQTGGVLQDRIELKRELHTVVAAKKMEFQIMCIVPYGILFYLKLFAPAMSDSLYHNTIGMFFMSMALLGYFGMKALGERIIQGEIGKVIGKNSVEQTKRK